MINKRFEMFTRFIVFKDDFFRYLVIAYFASVLVTVLVTILITILIIVFKLTIFSCYHFDFINWIAVDLI